VTLLDYFKKAQKEHWAIGQFNFSTLSQLKGIIEAAKKMKSPIILGTSEGESKFLGLEQAAALKSVFQKETGLPIFLNLDHGKSFEYLKEACDSGYEAVHFDGSELLIEENIERTKEVVKYAKKFGILVEGEVGLIGTETSKVYEEKFELKEKDLTNPEEAEKYIKETGVDSLAVSVGTFHGITVKGGNPRIRLERLKEIKEKVGDKFLVLHGGSGTLEEDIKKAVELGIVKVNINTELRLAYTNTLKKVLEENPKEIRPYKQLPEAIEAVQKVVEAKIQLFGSDNKL